MMISFAVLINGNYVGIMDERGGMMRLVNLLSDTDANTIRCIKNCLIDNGIRASQADAILRLLGNVPVEEPKEPPTFWYIVNYKGVVETILFEKAHCNEEAEDMAIRDVDEGKVNINLCSCRNGGVTGSHKMDFGELHYYGK